MKRAATILAALAAILADAATVRTATETFVTNRIAAAVAAIPAQDFSTNNAALVETIEARAPAPGNYAAVSNAAMTAVQPGDLPHNLTTNEVCAIVTNEVVVEFTAWAATNLDSTSMNVEIRRTGGTWTPYEVFGDDYSEPIGSGLGNGQSTELRWVAWEDGPFNIYARRYPVKSDNALGLARLSDLPAPGVSAEAVTNTVRDLSLGGIWDADLEVWWTPKMRNGSLTYEATTNVNLNAED